MLNQKRRFRSRPRKNGFSKKHSSSFEPSLKKLDFNNSNGSLNGNFKKINHFNSHELEKAINRFSQLAKDATSMGDIISQENYLQHVEHYSRRLAELRTQKSQETQEQSKSIDTVSATTETK